MNPSSMMRIRQPLPEALADKWRRLLAFQGGDPEALALAAVELLWKKYGREVARNERELAKFNMCPPVFVGRYELTVDDKGRCRLPKELASMSGGSFCWVRDGENVCIAPSAEYKGIAVKFGRGGRFSLPKFLQEQCPKGGVLVLRGKVRYLGAELRS